ncbi:MAG: hypothetical protein JWP35_707 [Caulobacter sp.]|nr:hypothetical protein [Caulobacter sp.]
MEETALGGSAGKAPDLAALAGFADRLADPAFNAGGWGGGERDPATGVIRMPYAHLSDVASAFVKAAYHHGWVLPGFDWVAWKGTPEAKRLAADRDAVAAASADQLARLLTVIIRQDRFVEGGLLSDFKSGFVAAIAARANVLLAKGA